MNAILDLGYEFGFDKPSVKVTITGKFNDESYNVLVPENKEYPEREIVIHADFVHPIEG